MTSDDPAACPFCVLARGGPDDDLVALRTASAFVLPAPRQRPANLGHALVLPRTHVTRIDAMDAAVLHDVYRTVGRVSLALRRAFGATGTLVFQNEDAPDQVLHHVHVHVVPRRPGDDFRLPATQKRELTREERRAQAAALRTALTHGAPENR